MADNELDERTVRDQDTLVNTTPSPVTAVDAAGIERIVTVDPGTYDPPQVEPDPKEVARLARLEGKLAEKKDERLAKLTGQSKAETKAEDKPAAKPAAKPAPAEKA